MKNKKLLVILDLSELSLEEVCVGHGRVSYNRGSGLESQ